MKYNDDLLTPEEVAKILQVHVLTVYSYIRRGNLGAIRLGRAYRIIPQDLELFIESNRVKKAGVKANSSANTDTGGTGKW